MLEEPGDLSLLESALETVLSVEDDYLEAPEAEEALAAAEVIARLQGHWGIRNAYTEPADAWVERVQLTTPADLVRMAHAAIDRILESPAVLELWEEGDDFEDSKSGNGVYLSSDQD